MISTILATVLLQASAAAANQQPAPQPAPRITCAGHEYDAFDFWVGEWDVYPTGQNTKVADSRVERLYGQCAIRENWMPLRGFPGGSLSSYDPETKRWHQTWVGGGGRVEFEGGSNDGAMVLTGYWPNVGGPGSDGLIRMTYSANDDGSVRQHGEVSFDHGLTWADSFDFTYRRKAG